MVRALLGGRAWFVVRHAGGAGISAVCAMRLSAGTRYAAVAIRGMLAPAQPGHAGGKSLRR